MNALAGANDIVAEGERIYEEKYRGACEEKYVGQYVVIDITTEKMYRSKQSQLALTNARKNSPNGVFHLIRVGSAGAMTSGFLGGYGGENRVGSF